LTKKTLAIDYLRDKLESFGHLLDKIIQMHPLLPYFILNKWYTYIWLFMS